MRISEYKLRRDAELELEGRGVTGVAARHLLDATAPGRHEGRVQAAIAAAKLAAAYVYAGGSQAVAWALLTVDAIGVGGRHNATGESTRRLPCLATLGKGRKQAHDGAAWTAAIAEAARRLGGRSRIFPNIGESDASLAVIDEDGVSWGLPDSLVPSMWVDAVLMAGLRHACGVELEGAVEVEGLLFSRESRRECDPGVQIEWAEAYNMYVAARNAACEAAEVEIMEANEITFGILDLPAEICATGVIDWLTANDFAGLVEDFRKGRTISIPMSQVREDATAFEAARTFIRARGPSCLRTQEFASC